MKRALILTAAAVAMLVAAPTAAQDAPRPPRVLLLFQQQAETQPMLEFTERLRAAVRRELGASVEFYQESLDLDRFRDPAQALAVARYFDDKYRRFAVDAVVPVGGRALQFAIGRADAGHVLAGVPIVFGLTAAPQVDPAALPPNVTGRIAAASRFAPTLAMARALQPDAQRIVVVGGAGGPDSASVAAAVAAAAPLRDSLPLTVLQGLPLDVLLARLRQLPRRTIVLFANYRQNGQGQAFEPLDIVGSIAHASAAPTYVQLRSYVGEGVVGGFVIRFDDEGTATGRLVVRVLRRRPGEPMPPPEPLGKAYTVDWRALRRWGLDERRLPTGTEVLFRIPSTWERYRATILSGLGLMIAQALLIGMLLVERDRRRRAQRALAEQAEYERTIAELTTDAARHAPADAARALEDALSRIAAYAGAHTATLVQYADSTARPPTRLRWTGVPDGSGGRVARLEIPLVVAGQPVGALELERPDTGAPWPAALVARLGAAAELIAGAIARANAAAAADEARRQTAHLGRVALVGELAATISHELRQPLTAIRTTAEVGSALLAAPRPDLREVTQLFDEIVADVVRAIEVVEHVRLLLRKQEPGVAEVDLNEICRQAALLLDRDVRSRDIRLELALAPALPPVIANAIEMQQVVLNIVLNALDALASQGGGGPRRVVVATAAEGEGSAVVLSVRDTGPGLTSEAQTRLFDSFFSTKVHGLGVGLAIVRSIVARHHGSVTAENVAGSGGGALFRVSLPAANGVLVALPSARRPTAMA